MNRFKLILIGVIFSSCTGTAQQVDEALTSDKFVRWNKEQQITFDLFEGKGPKDAYSMWIGFYFVWDFKGEEFRFNVTTFMDKEKSYIAESTEFTDTGRLAFFPVMYKLKFDVYEIGARRFRKHLIENQKNFNHESGEELQALSAQYYDEIVKGWEVIDKDLQANFNGEKFEELKESIDNVLIELRDYDSSVNSYYKNSSR